MNSWLHILNDVLVIIKLSLEAVHITNKPHNMEEWHYSHINIAPFGQSKALITIFEYR